MHYRKSFQKAPAHFQDPRHSQIQRLGNAYKVIWHFNKKDCNWSDLHLVHQRNKVLSPRGRFNNALKKASKSRVHLRILCTYQVILLFGISVVFLSETKV